MADLTLKELKSKKADVEGSFIKALRTFEKETNTEIRYINIDRKGKDRFGEKQMTEKEAKKKRPIVNVSLEIDVIDLLT